MSSCGQIKADRPGFVGAFSLRTVLLSALYTFFIFSLFILIKGISLHVAACVISAFCHYV